MNGINRDLPIPPTWRDEWAAQLAEEARKESRGRIEKVFVAQLGNEWFALPASVVARTVPDQKFCRLPHQLRSPVEGLVNADGKIILGIAVERSFELSPVDDASGYPRVIVIHDGSWNFAFRVRQVLGILEIDVSRLQPIGDGAVGPLRRCTRGVLFHEGRSLVCLDGERFITEVRTLIG